MRGLAFGVLAILLAGCAAPTETILQNRSNGPQPGVHIAIPIPFPQQQINDTPPGKPSHDPKAPSLFLDGNASFATALVVRENAHEGTRSPCGGAVWATPEGEADPRGQTWAFVSSITLLDAEGHSWTTFEYASNASRAWVALVGGGTTFVPDDGNMTCPITAAHNVLLHAEGPEWLSVWYDPARGPP